MATGFTPPTMNWNASDIPDEFNSFKPYCNLVFYAISKENRKGKSILYITMDWATGSRYLQ